jgi:hypothetical protein
MKQFLNVLHVYNILLLGEKSVQALKVAMRLEPFSHSPILASCCAPLLHRNIEADLTTKNLLRVDTKNPRKQKEKKRSGSVAEDLLKRVSRP